MTQRKWFPVLCATFVIAAAAAARADEPGSPIAPPALPSSTTPHGGVFIGFLPPAGPMEMVLDAQSGTLTAYSAPLAPDSAGSGLRQPTSVAVVLDSGREVKLTEVAGVSNTWTARDDAFRSESITALLRLRVGDKTLEAPFRLPKVAVSVVPTGYVEPQPSRGGRFVSLCGASFEAVHDRAAGTIALYARKDPARPITIAGSPTLSVPTASGPRDVVLLPIEGTPDAWSATSDLLKSDALSGTFRATLDGLPCQAPWTATAPPVELRLVLGNDAAVLRMVHDTSLGRLTFSRLDLSPSSANAATIESPAVVLRSDAGARTLPLARVGAEDAWSVTDPSLRAAAIVGTFQAKVGGRSYETTLPAEAWPESDAALLTFGDGAAHLRAMFDPPSGRLWLDPMGVGTAVALDEAPVLVARGLPGFGPKQMTLTAEKSSFGGWSVRIERWKDATSIDATVRIKVAGRAYEAVLLRPTPPARAGGTGDREPR